MTNVTMLLSTVPSERPRNPESWSYFMLTSSTMTAIAILKVNKISSSIGGNGNTIIANIITISTGPASVRKPARLIKSCSVNNKFTMFFLLHKALHFQQAPKQPIFIIKLSLTFLSVTHTQIPRHEIHTNSCAPG